MTFEHVQNLAETVSKYQLSIPLLITTVNSSHSLTFMCSFCEMFRRSQTFKESEKRNLKQLPHSPQCRRRTMLTLTLIERHDVPCKFPLQD